MGPKGLDLVPDGMDWSTGVSDSASPAGPIAATTAM